MKRPASGRDCFELVKACVASVLEVDPLSFSDKTRLLRDYALTNEDAADIARAISERGGFAWEDGDAQTMRMSLLQLSLVETSHLVADRVGVPRLEAWPAAGAAGGADFV